MKNKVCIITTSLAKGGAERSSAILTKVLGQVNYQVHIIVTKNVIDYEFSGTLLNLELEMGKNPSNLKKVKILRAYFKNHKFDAIIDNRCRSNFLKEYILYRFVFKAKKIITIVHNYSIQKYLPKNKVLAKLIFNKNFALVAVSNEIKNEIQRSYPFKNVFTINNAMDFQTIESLSLEEHESLDFKYILWFGRVVERVKNLSLLLEAYKKSSLTSKGIKLVIMGEGEDLKSTMLKSNNMNLKDHVVYFPYLKNPFFYVKNALFTVLTSRHEGLPMAILEALACKTPVVSVNCKSGPSEIIKHRDNGLLVENYNPNALADAFDSFVEDESLYLNCKANARLSIEDFSMKNIGLKWIELIG